MTGLGTAMAGGKASGARQDLDWYPTPDDVTRALLIADGRHMPYSIWEPACGDGAMAEVLRGWGHDVFATDIVDRGYSGQRATADFFAVKTPMAHGLITNPPFSLAHQWIQHALALCPGYVALLTKSTFWHAGRRADLFESHPPAAVYPLLWRPDFLRLGAPTMEAAWNVWRPHDGETIYRPLRRPAR